MSGKNIRNTSVNKIVINLSSITGPVGATGTAGTPGVDGDLSNCWQLLGNTGTNISINYVGTSDDTDLLITTHGDLGGGFLITRKNQIMPQNAELNTLFGMNAGDNISGATGNIFIGNDAGLQFSSGCRNICFGPVVGFEGTENDCIFIGCSIDDFSQSGNDGRIMIGNSNSRQSFLQGIHGNTPASSLAVTCNSFGALGTVVS